MRTHRTKLNCTLRAVNAPYRRGYTIILMKLNMFMSLRKITNKKHTRVFKIAFLKQKLRFFSLKNAKIAYLFGSE